MLKSSSVGKRMLDLVPLTCLLCMAMISNPWGAIAEDASSESLINCDIHHGPCAEFLQGLTVTLDILPKPVTAMKDLRFEVTLSGGTPKAAPCIDLGMPGMAMGPNRVELRAVKDSVYEGQGIIVRCPSGRRTWKATVTVPGSGQAEFVFDVIY